ncbi:hypothetical protein ACLOJK_029219 [Asimina triloba]
MASIFKGRQRPIVVDPAMAMHTVHPQSQPRPSRRQPLVARFDECHFRPHFYGPSKQITDIKQRWPNHSRSSECTNLRSSPWCFFFTTVQQRLGLMPAISITPAASYQARTHLRGAATWAAAHFRKSNGNIYDPASIRGSS